MGKIFFKRWSNKKYAVLNSFHKVIHIGTLSLACTLVQSQPVLTDSDTSVPAMHFELEEVETISEQEAEIYSPLLRQLFLITQQQIEYESSGSIARILDYYPGIDLRSRGMNNIQSDLSIQSGTFDQSMILLNGINMSDPQTGHFSMDLPLSNAQIYQMEILKGPASKKYGPNAYTGAVNILTKPEDSLALEADLSFGSFNTYTANTSLHLPAGPIKNMLSASFAGSDGYQSNTDYQNANLYLHSVGGNTNFSSEMILGWNQKAFGANSFYTPRFPNQYEETKSLIAALKFQSFNSMPGLDASLFWRRHYDHFLLFRNNPSAYENYHLTDVIEANIGSYISSIYGLTNIDLRYRHEQIYSTNLGEKTSELLIVKGTDAAYYTHFKSRNQVSLSADHLAQFGPVYMNIGLLIHSSLTEISNIGIYPGFDISYTFNAQISVFSSVNRSMRLPTFTDLYYSGPQNNGNAELLPEKAWTYEAGIKYGSTLVKADLAFFYRKGQESIDWIWTDSIWQTKNLTELNTIGAETSISIHPAKYYPSFSLIDYFRLSYSWSEINKANDSYISNYALDNLRHKFIADMRFQIPLNIFIDAKVLRQERNGAYLFYQTPESVPIETSYRAFWLLDLCLGIKVNDLQLTIDATNLLNTTYRDIGSVIMPGRWIMCGVKYKL